VCCARHRMVAGRFLYYYNMFLAKVALIGESLGLPPGLAAGPMLVAACEAMGIQPGQGTPLPIIADQLLSSPTKGCRCRLPSIHGGQGGGDRACR
jgi:hypothetical protein